MEDKKYILTDEVIEYYGYKLYRVMAIKDFGDVHKGDLGGWIESEDNLGQEYNCWVSDNAKVYGRARVFGDALIYDNAEIFGDAMICENTLIYGNALIYGDAEIFGDAKVYGNAIIYGKTEVYGRAEVFGNAEIFGDLEVFENARVCGKAKVFGYVYIRGDANIESNEDYAVFKNTWSSDRYFIWTRSNNMWSVGCFYGTGEELIKKAYEDSETSGKCYEIIVKAQEAISNVK